MAARVLVDVVPVKGCTGTSRRGEVFCGAGEQVLRWLCFAALTRTAYELGDNPGGRPEPPRPRPSPRRPGELSRPRRLPRIPSRGGRLPRFPARARASGGAARCGGASPTEQLAGAAPESLRLVIPVDPEARTRAPPLARARGSPGQRGPDMLPPCSPQKYVPQGVLSSKGVVYDPDTVLNEVLEDGDSVTVEYSSGPQAFTTRWEGRPLTSILRYDDDGILEPLPDDFWLREMDLPLYGVEKLLEENLKGDARSRDMEATREELLKNAGPLQVVFNYYEARSDEDTSGMGLMNMADYRIMTQETGLCTDGSHFVSTRADDLFNETLKSMQAAEADLGLKTTGRSLGFKGFLILLLKVANEKFMMDVSPSKPKQDSFKTGNAPPAVSFMELHMKLTYLCENYLYPSVFPPLQKSYDRFKTTMTPGTDFLFERGRKLIRSALDSCQLRRVAGEPMNVSFKHLSSHLEKWGFLHGRLNMQDLHLIMEWAKHGNISLAEATCKSIPICIDYSEFERLLCAMCYTCFINEGSQLPFEEFFGDCLDIIFKMSGVLS